jgi:hypothetical protein
MLQQVHRNLAGYLRSIRGRGTGAAPAQGVRIGVRVRGHVKFVRQVFLVARQSSLKSSIASEASAP